MKAEFENEWVRKKGKKYSPKALMLNVLEIELNWLIDSMNERQ